MQELSDAGKKRMDATALWWRFLLAIFFMICLSFFLQFREVRMDILEQHSVSKQYVVAQVDFEFPDQAKTQLLRFQAEADIGPVYRFDSRELSRSGQELEQSLLQDQDWRSSMPAATFEQLYEQVEFLEEFLVETRFSDDRTVKKIEGLDVTHVHLFQIAFSKDEPPTISPAYWAFVKHQMLQEVEGDPQVIDFVIQSFAQKNWGLQRDLALEKKLKQVAGESIEQQYSFVAAGSLLLEPGEEVTLKHIVMLQAMNQALSNPHPLKAPLSVLGNFVLSCIITFLTAIYLSMYHQEIVQSLRKLALLTLIAVITLGLAKSTEYLLLYQGYNLIEVVRCPLVIPFASLLLCILLGPRIALFSSIFLSVMISLALVIEYDRFLILNLIAAMCTIMFARSLHKRKEIFEVCGKVWIFSIPVLVAFHLIKNNSLDSHFFEDVLTLFFFMLTTAVVVIGFLPVLETLFKVMTNMTLVEFMDPNNELLRRLSVEAPGTYQHSLVVGNLAEVSARAIGANHLFCRVATLYHDIGKLFNPHYFTENQLGGFNIHQLLTPLESAQVIIAHVSEGEILAKKHHLPQGFIEIIREHHGTTLVYFFYCKQIEQMGGDVSKVQKKLFQYAGPKPRTKESALIMIADMVEAASRSLEEATEETVEAMIDRLISEKIEEKQFDDCPLTFEELKKVKKAIGKALLITRHLRVKYPSRPQA